MSSKDTISLKDAVRAAATERNKQASNEASYNDSKLASYKDSDDKQDNLTDELVGLNIRVPKRHRLHWLIAAKKEGTNLTAAVNEALAARFGLPSDEE